MCSPERIIPELEDADAPELKHDCPANALTWLPKPALVQPGGHRQAEQIGGESVGRFA